MSVAEIYENVVRDLPEHEQRELAETICRQLERRTGGERRVTWRDMRGRLPVNSMGEDAQAWVSRSRREAGDRSDRQLERDR